MYAYLLSIVQQPQIRYRNPHALVPVDDQKIELVDRHRQPKIHLVQDQSKRPKYVTPMDADIVTPKRVHESRALKLKIPHSSHVGNYPWKWGSPVNPRPVFRIGPGEEQNNEIQYYPRNGSVGTRRPADKYLASPHTKRGMRIHQKIDPVRFSNDGEGFGKTMGPITGRPDVNAASGTHRSTPFRPLFRGAQNETAGRLKRRGNQTGTIAPSRSPSKRGLGMALAANLTKRDTSSPHQHTRNATDWQRSQDNWTIHVSPAGKSTGPRAGIITTHAPTASRLIKGNPPMRPISDRHIQAPNNNPFDALFTPYAKTMSGQRLYAKTEVRAEEYSAQEFNNRETGSRKWREDIKQI